MIDADVLESTQGHFRLDIAQLQVAHGHTLPPLRGHVTLGSLPVAMVLVLLYNYHSKKKARETGKKYGKKVREKSTRKKSTGKKSRGKSTGGKPGMRRTYFRKKSTGNRNKGGKPQLPVKRAGHPVGYQWGDLRSLLVALSVMRTFDQGHFRLGMPVAPHSTSTNDNLSVPIYYYGITVKPVLRGHFCD